MYYHDDITILILPAHWAPALINGDTSGLDDEDEQHLDLILADLGSMHCVDADENAGFYHRHDASSYGVLACDCCVYTFLANPNLEN